MTQSDHFTAAEAYNEFERLANSGFPEKALEVINSIGLLDRKLAAFEKAAVAIREAGRIPEAVKLLETQGDKTANAFFWNCMLNCSLNAEEIDAILADFANFAKAEGEWERSIEDEDWLHSEINDIALVHEEIILKTIGFLVGKNLTNELLIRMAPLVDPGYWMEDIEDIIEELEKSR